MTAQWVFVILRYAELAQITGPSQEIFLRKIVV